VTWCCWTWAVSTTDTAQVSPGCGVIGPLTCAACGLQHPADTTATLNMSQDMHMCGWTRCGQCSLTFSLFWSVTTYSTPASVLVCSRAKHQSTLHTKRLCHFAVLLCVLHPALSCTQTSPAHGLPMASSHSSRHWCTMLCWKHTMLWWLRWHLESAGLTCRSVHVVLISFFGGAGCKWIL
jgi:hypothetical protein